MRAFRWLCGITVAMAVVLIGAIASSYAVSVGEWYDTLLVPAWFRALPHKWIWCVMYLADIAVLARVLVATRSMEPFALAGFRGWGRCVWCLLFFRAHAVAWAAGYTVLLGVWEIASLCRVRRYDPIAFGIHLWQSGWLAVCIAVCWTVAAVNGCIFAR